MALSPNPHIEAVLEKYESKKFNMNQTLLALRQCGLTPEAAERTIREFNTSRAAPNNAALEATKAHEAAVAAYRAVPASYTHEITTHRCQTCGSASHSSRLLAHRIMGSGNTVKTIVRIDEPIYAGLAITDEEITMPTRICIHCVDTAPRAPVPPKPENTEFRRGVKAQVSPAKAEKKPFDLFDI